MSNSIAQLRTPTVTLDGSIFSQIHVNSVTITAGLNGYPTVSIVPVPENSKTVSKITDSKLLAYYASLQNLKFSATSAVSATLYVTDGNGGKMTLPLAFIAPKTAIGADKYAMQLEFAGLLSRIDAFRSDIYDSNNFSEYFGATAGKGENDPANLTTDLPFIAKVMDDVLTELIRLWDKDTSSGTVTTTYREEDAALVRRIHLNNTFPRTLVTQLFNYNPSASVSYVLQALQVGGEAAKQDIIPGIVRSMASILLSSSSGFMNTILDFCQMFDLVLAPGFSKIDIGKFISTDAMSSGIAVPKEIIVSSFAPQLGLQTSVPITAITVRGVTGLKAKQDETDNQRTLNSSGQILAIWPDAALSPTTPGFPATVSPPSWIPQAPSASPTSLELIKKSLDGTRDTPDAVLKEIATAADGASTLISTMLQALARSRYIDFALQGDSVTVETPLSLDWLLGQRYEIKSKKLDGSAETLFKGALAAVRHEIARPESAGSSGLAHTTLTFSHVEMGGFELPFKK